jgi:hypothetical protein
MPGREAGLAQILGDAFEEAERHLACVAGEFGHGVIAAMTQTPISELLLQGGGAVLHGHVAGRGAHLNGAFGLGIGFYFDR